MGAKPNSASGTYQFVVREAIFPERSTRLLVVQTVLCIMEEQVEKTVPIKLRAIEIEQLREWVPKVLDRVSAAAENVGTDTLDETLETLEQFADRDIEHEDDNVFVGYLYATPDEWQTIIRELDRLYNTEGRSRVEYLQSKLVRRLSETVDEL